MFLSPDHSLLLPPPSTSSDLRLLCISSLSDELVAFRLDPLSHILSSGPNKPLLSLLMKFIRQTVISRVKCHITCHLSYHCYQHRLVSPRCHPSILPPLQAWVTNAPTWALLIRLETVSAAHSPGISPLPPLHPFPSPSAGLGDQCSNAGMSQFTQLLASEGHTQGQCM